MQDDELKQVIGLCDQGYWDAHLIHSYAEANNDESILHILIPKSKDGTYNEKCAMFLASPTLGDLFDADGTATPV